MWVFFPPGNTKWQMTPVLQQSLEDLRALEWETMAASMEDLAVASMAEVAALVRVRVGVWVEAMELEEGQG